MKIHLKPSVVIIAILKKSCQSFDRYANVYEFIMIGFLLLYEPGHEKTRFLHRRKKGTDQLCSNSTADQRLCSSESDSTFLFY